MKELAIGILDYNKKYEMARCRRLLKEMGVSQESVFKWEGTGQLKTRREEYVAFWDVLDKWEMQKAVACMSRLAENDADVLIHSHIWHAGLKSIPYRVVDSGQADMGRLLCQGLPGISAVVFSRKWLLGLLLEKEQIKIGSGEFYRLLFSALMNGRCRTELIAQQLSEHWSYYGGRTPSVKQARNDILKYWGAMDAEARNTLLPLCYGYFLDNYGESPATEFFEGLSVSDDELAELLRTREDRLVRQLRTAEAKAERKNDFYIFMRDWVELRQSGTGFAEKLLEEGISTVAVYGTGKHGKMLYNELKGTDVRVSCWIDKKGVGETLEGQPVIGTDVELPQVDAVIVTPYREFRSIESSLWEKMKARIIPLDMLVRRQSSCLL